MYAGYIFSIPLLGIYANFLQWLEGMELALPSRKFFTVECPGCGLQRSMMALLRGGWAESWSYYPAWCPFCCCWHLRLSIYERSSILAIW
jgi:hypothetical protein